jgi:hypothetical protein
LLKVAVTYMLPLGTARVTFLRGVAVVCRAIVYFMLIIFPI